MAIEQLRAGSDNFSYLLISPPDNHAALVDPSLDATAALHRINDLGLTLDYIIITHYHSDHTAAVPTVKRHHPAAKIVASEADGRHLKTPPEVNVKDGTILKVGVLSVKVIATPGHTPGGICLLVDNEALITGDTLFIGDCGRTDLSGGSLREMFDSLQKKIMPLPDSLLVYPGHDYGDRPYDTLGHQKQTNKTLQAKTLEDFAKIP
jgi:hydroxyacylglutathione hydrolase